MKTLTELIQNYQNGIPNSDSEILKRMEPLVKGYASRIHCMEREDSIQELYLTLLKTLPYLSSSSSEGECIRYMQTSVENRYRSLCRSCLSEPEKDDFDSCSVSLQAPDSFDDTYYDVTDISTLTLRTVSREKFCPCTFIRIKAMPRLLRN